MLEITRLFPLLAALGCAVCALTVELVEPVVCCVFVVAVAVVVVDDVVVAIALFGLKPAGKYSTDEVHDSGDATGKLATGKSALPPVAVGRLSNVVFVFFNTA